MRRSLFRWLIFGATVSERRQQHAKALDGRLPSPDQLRQLGRMAADAFVDIRNTRDIDLANALADAFHNLPAVVHWPEFSWSWLLVFLNGLERLYPEVGRRYLAAFDQVVGFYAEPGAAADGGG
jgi:hypothetical protein